MSEQISQCEQCKQRYNLFRRRKQCDLCGQIFCSKCVSKSRLNNSRECLICLLIINERTSRDQLSSIRVKHLRAYLIHSKIISTNRLELLIEKQDLVNLIESNKRQILPNENFNRDEIVNINNPQDVEEEEESIVNEDEQVFSSLNNTSSTLSNEPPIRESVIEVPPPTAPSIPQFDRITLSELSSLESIHELTVRQLKDILQQNFVSTKGCVEKHELINKVELLYHDQQQQQQIKSDTTTNNSSDDNLCKVCMDANIDCVFLDCGHLCTCIQCGKKLSECPLCRCYIIRVVRVFKS